MGAKIKVTLTVLEGDDRGKIFTLTKERTVMGRARGDFLLSDKKVSSEHLCFVIEDGSLFLEDLASTNGTFVNDNRVEERLELDNLDEVSLGFTKLRVAIVEDLAQFRKTNKAASGASSKANSSAPKTKKPSAKGGKTPSSIGNLIDEELKRFSRWDIAQKEDSLGSFNKSLQLPKVALELHVIEGPDKGKVVRLPKGNSVIGRGKADLKFNDNDISRNHASIETFSETQIFLRDMASTNGTFLNNKRITYSKLSHGDLIQIGSTVLRFVVGGDE